MTQYEAMFLFDPAMAPDFGKAKEEVDRILGRAGAEIVFCEKWDERKLAYEIKGRKRGLYVLTYFKCDGKKVVGLERDARLSEAVLRVLVTRAEGITPEQMAKFLPQQQRAVEDERPDEGSAPRRSRRAVSDDDAEDDAAPQRSRTAVAVAERDDAGDLEAGE